MTPDFGQIPAAQTRNRHLRVGCPRAGKQRQKSKGCFELCRKNLGMDSVLKPPSFLPMYVALRRCRESYGPRGQRDRSSFRISSAPTSRPAATSASDWRRASWSAARSVSSSQSPGSSGRRSISVPSGRSVGSSTTSRPSRTCALTIMKASVALAWPPNKTLQPTSGALRFPCSQLGSRAARG